MIGGTEAEALKNAAAKQSNLTLLTTNDAMPTTMLKNHKHFCFSPPYTLVQEPGCSEVVVVRNQAGPPYTVKKKKVGAGLAVIRNPPFVVFDDWNPRHRIVVELQSHGNFLNDTVCLNLVEMNDARGLNLAHVCEVAKQSCPYMFHIVDLVENTNVQVKALCESNGSRLPLFKIKELIAKLVKEEEKMFGMFKSQMNLVFGLNRRMIVSMNERSILARAARVHFVEFREMSRLISTISNESKRWKFSTNSRLIVEMLDDCAVTAKTVCCRWLMQHGEASFKQRKRRLVYVPN